MSEHSPTTPTYAATELHQMVDGGYSPDPHIPGELDHQTIVRNTRWEVSITDEWPADPTPVEDLPEVILPTTSYKDVVTAVESAEEARTLYEGVEITGKEYGKRLKGVVSPIDDDDGIDHLAHMSVEGQKVKDELGRKSGLGEEPGLVGEELDGYWELTRDLLTIKDMVKALPRESRKEYEKLVKEKLNPTRPGASKGNTASSTHGAEDDSTPKTKEAHVVRRRVAKTLGVVAIFGVGFALAKSATGPEHVMQHGQMEGVSGQDNVSLAEVTATYMGYGSAAIMGIRHHVRKKAAVKAHHEHNVNERAHKEADSIAFETMLDPESLASSRLIDAMKHPLLLDEINERGAGPSESMYASDVVIRYARLVAPRVGGTAAKVKEHLQNLGINIGDTEITDAMTPAGHTTINMHNPNHAEMVHIAQELTQGHLKFGDLPPTDLFLDDPIIAAAIHLITTDADRSDPVPVGLYDQLKWASEHPYTRSGGPTSYQIGYEINKNTEVVFDKLAWNLPNDEARKAALSALRFNDLLEDYIPVPGQPSRYRRKVHGRNAVPIGVRVAQYADAA